MWIDSHCHLNNDAYDADVAEVIARAEQAGVEKMLVVGWNASSSESAVKLAEAFPCLFAAVALQPNDLAEHWRDDFRAIVKLADHPKVVAIGESGVDDYWKKIPMDRQQDSFKAHLELAHQLNKPIVIHCRDAESYALATLQEFLDQHSATSPLHGLMHSYTGSTESVRAFLSIGFSVSFAGMVTFKKSEPLRETSDVVPIDRLLIETDCPWLSPEPMRKERRNEPALVVHTGKMLADRRGMSHQAFAEQVRNNAQRLFRW